MNTQEKIKEKVENRLLEIIGDLQALEEIKVLTNLLKALERAQTEPVGMKFYYTTSTKDSGKEI